VCVPCTQASHCTGGSVCQTATCVSNSCVYTNNNALCTGGTECTSAVCDASGCTYPNLADGTPCSIGTCQSGVCTAPPPVGDARVFRMDSVMLVDPHVVFHKVLPPPFPLLGNCTVCRDITHNDRTATCWTQSVPLPGLNPALSGLVTTDGNGDGYLDLSFMLVFEPHNQANGGGGNITVTEGLCLASDQTNCEPDPDSLNTDTTTYASQTSGTCLGPIPGTLGPWATGAPNGTWQTPQPIIPPNQPSGACFVSAATTFSINLEFELDGQIESLSVPLLDARIAGQWVNDPATSISNGLVRGFLTMQEADQQHLTLTVAVIGAINVNLGRDLLPDNAASTGSAAGAHGCGNVTRAFPTGGTAGRNAHCKGGDTRDLRNSGSGASYQNCGWWFYINYTGIWASNASGF
jgi:hypothetical protein